MTLCSRGPAPGALKKWISPCSPRMALASLRIGEGELMHPPSGNMIMATAIETHPARLRAEKILFCKFKYLQSIFMGCLEWVHASVNFDQARDDKLLYHTARWGRRRDVM